MSPISSGSWWRRCAAASRRGGISPVCGENHVGREHGRQRFRLGFDVGALVREYGVLRGCILDLVEESGCPVSLPEVRVLTDFIATAIAEGVAEHERQAKRAQQAAEGPCER
ncbi:hypothetical protein [Archangium sp.]|uniref:hypothetical protein n=1 Tax=Archangium sp. TaxID=1872627 RepID=UPI002D4EE7AE|nr:hypothetical protein [Archangium sp.]HYO57500.1 hypothetical protein [Archangium sp.]